MSATPLDYGQRTRRARGVQITTPIMVGLAMVVGVGVTVWAIRDKARLIHEATADTQASEIVGPACPRVLHGVFTSPLRPVNSFDFNGLTFGHRFGSAECSVTAGRRGLLGTGYVNLCQFSSPAVLSVTGGSGIVYWEPGLGREATVFVDGDKARCVMASPYFKLWKQRVTETDTPRSSRLRTPG